MTTPTEEEECKAKLQVVTPTEEEECKAKDESWSLTVSGILPKMSRHKDSKKIISKMVELAWDNQIHFKKAEKLELQAERICRETIHLVKL